MRDVAFRQRSRGMLTFACAMLAMQQPIAADSLLVLPSRSTLVLRHRGGSECAAASSVASIGHMRTRLADSTSIEASGESNVTSRSLNSEFIEIMGPALLGLTIEPVASLVDTAFVGRLCGKSALAGVGVASSVFNVLAKTCNFLQSATTSHVARAGSRSSRVLVAGEFDVAMARVASAAIYVAAAAGSAIAIGLRCSGSASVRGLGVADQAEVATAAMAYLAARSWAAPAALALMALQGAFRGARDSASPVSALCVATIANVALDALLVPAQGALGAAVATSLSQIAGAALLVSRLARRTATTDLSPGRRAPRDLVGLVRPELADCALIARSGSVLMLRTLSGVFAMQYASIVAAKLGPAEGAAHVIAFQIWLAASLMADAVAVAVQALLADAIASRNKHRATATVLRAATFAAVIAGVNALVLTCAGPVLCSLFTNDRATLAHTAAVWPIVVRSQAYSCGAFVCDGMLFAAVDFNYCAIAMITSSLISLVAQLALSKRFGLTGVWLGLEVIMFLRFATGAVRVVSQQGPWRSVFAPVKLSTLIASPPRRPKLLPVPLVPPKVSVPEGTEIHAVDDRPSLVKEGTDSASAALSLDSEQISSPSATARPASP